MLPFIKMLIVLVISLLFKSSAGFLFGEPLMQLTNSSSACYGPGTHGLFRPSCPSGSFIAMDRLMIGAKLKSDNCPRAVQNVSSVLVDAFNNSIPLNYDCCFPEVNKTGSCIYEYNYYNTSKANYLSLCLGKQSCDAGTEVSWAPRDSSCSNTHMDESNYMYMEYACINKTTIHNIGSNFTKSNIPGKPIYLQSNGYPDSKNTIFDNGVCHVTFNASSLFITLIDVRLNGSQVLNITGDKSFIYTAANSTGYNRTVLELKTDFYITFTNNGPGIGGNIWIALGANASSYVIKTSSQVIMKPGVTLISPGPGITSTPSNGASSVSTPANGPSSISTSFNGPSSISTPANGPSSISTPFNGPSSISTPSNGSISTSSALSSAHFSNTARPSTTSGANAKKDSLPIIGSSCDPPSIIPIIVPLIIIIIILIIIIIILIVYIHTGWKPCARGTGTGTGTGDTNGNLHWPGRNLDHGGSGSVCCGSSRGICCCGSSSGAKMCNGSCWECYAGDTESSACLWWLKWLCCICLKCCQANRVHPQSTDVQVEITINAPQSNVSNNNDNNGEAQINVRNNNDEDARMNVHMKTGDGDGKPALHVDIGAGIETGVNMLSDL